MPCDRSTASRKRPGRWPTSTLRADLPADVFAILANVSGMARPDVLTLILADQRSRWLAGSPVETERYLELLPDLAGDPEARLALVAGELRAREEAGLGLDAGGVRPEVPRPRRPDHRDLRDDPRA